MGASAVFLACLLMIGVALPSVFGCMCTPFHPQKQFCDAALVIVGTVRTKQLLYGPPHPAILPGQPTNVKYNVQVNSIKKGEEYEGQLWDTVDKELVVGTWASNTSCGVPWLETGRQYVLTVLVFNGEASLDFCYFHRAYDELSDMQRRGINGAYSRGCAQQCQVDTCRQNGCPLTPPNNRTCMHGNSHGHEDCYYHHGYCRARLSGKCAWKTNGAFDICLQQSNQIL